MYVVTTGPEAGAVVQQGGSSAATVAESEQALVAAPKSCGWNVRTQRAKLHAL